MSSICMNSDNSKISDVHKLRIDLADNIDLRRGDIRVALSELSNYSTWKNIKESYKNNKQHQEQYRMNS